jgi:hypothetical protein
MADRVFHLLVALSLMIELSVSFPRGPALGFFSSHRSAVRRLPTGYGS